MVSAGTIKHELTSHLAFDSVFKFFDEKLTAPDLDELDISEDQPAVPEKQADASKNTMETPENLGQTSMETPEKPGDASQNAMETPENGNQAGDASQSEMDSSQSQVDDSNGN